MAKVRVRRARSGGLPGPRSIRPRQAPEARYEVRVTLAAPPDFVYAWATDYTPEDPRYAGEAYIRRVIRRSPRSVVLEDLYDTGTAWVWLRRVVRLFPPARWHADTIGSDRRISVDYRLSPSPGNRTQLTILARRRPSGVGTKNPSKSAWERGVAANWRRLGKVLERDYARRRSLR